MPVMEGDEFAVSIKLLSPWLPILMITGSERARGDVNNPVDALLNKPFTVADLRFTLGKLLAPRPDPAERSAVLV
jgi:CheY-like chemotaxis protein